MPEDTTRMHSVEIPDNASSHFDAASVHGMRDELVNPRPGGWKPTLELDGKRRRHLLASIYIAVFILAVDAATWSTFLQDFQASDSTFMFFLGFTSSLPGWAYTIRLTGLKVGWSLAWAVFFFGYVIEIIAWFVTATSNEVEQWLEANVACRLLEGIGGAGMLVGVLVMAPELYPPDKRYGFLAIIWAAFTGLGLTGMAYYTNFILYWIGYHIPQLLSVILIPLSVYLLHVALPTPYLSSLRTTLTETYDHVGAILFWFSSSAVLIPAYILPAMFLGHYLIVAVVLFGVAVALAAAFGVWEYRRWTQYVGTSIWGEDGERSEKEDRVFLPFYLWRNWDLWVIGVTELFVGATTFGAIKYMTRIVWITEIATQTLTDGSQGMFLAYLLLNFGMLISSLACSFAYPRFRSLVSPRYTFWAGVGIVTLASVLSTFELSLLKAYIGAAPMGYCFMFGFGVGIVLQMGMVMGQAQVELKDFHVVTALLAGFFFCLGGGIASAILTGVYYVSYEHYLDEFNFLAFQNSTIPVSDPSNPIYNQSLPVVIDPDADGANLWARMNATYMALNINVMFAFIALVAALFLGRHAGLNPKSETKRSGIAQEQAARGRRDDEAET